MTERDGAVPFREVVWEEAGGRRLKTGVLEEAAREIERQTGLTPERINRWAQYIGVPYSELADDVQEHDRKWARLAIQALTDAGYRLVPAAPAPPALDVERLAEGLQANYGHAFPTGVDWLSDAEQLLRDARLAAQQDAPET